MYVVAKPQGLRCILKCQKTAGFRAIAEFSFGNKALGMHGKSFIWADMKSQG
jgi:hypothetical protein